MNLPQSPASDPLAPAPATPSGHPDPWGPVPAVQREAALAYLQQAREAAQQGAEWQRAGPQDVAGEAPTADGAPQGDARVCVVGAGTMGAGIAQAALVAGHVVGLLDQSAAALERAQGRIARSLQSAVARGRLAAGDAAAHLARLHCSTTDAPLATADVVVEAIFESLALKQALMARLGRACPPHALLVSNTSTLDIDALADSSARAAQVLGMHFLTPAHVTPLVEVIRGGATSRASLQRARALAQRLGKLPVWAGNAWGFIGNRMYEGYLREVDALQLEGVPAQAIDAALEGFGFAMGPCRQLDMAGTDLVSLCAEEAAHLGITQRPQQDARAIVRRCVQPLIEEGASILREGMACRASDIDLVWVLGYGFPAERGGPMFLAGRAG